MNAVLRVLTLAVLVGVAYGTGRSNTASAAPCRRGLL